MSGHSKTELRRGRLSGGRSAMPRAVVLPTEATTLDEQAFLLADPQKLPRTGQTRSDQPTVTWRFVTAVAKGEPHHWTSMGGDAQKGDLRVMFDGPRVNSSYDPMRKQGAILLGNVTLDQLDQLLPPQKPDGTRYSSWTAALTDNGGSTTGVTPTNTVFGLAISPILRLVELLRAGAALPLVATLVVLVVALFAIIQPGPVKSLADRYARFLNAHRTFKAFGAALLVGLLLLWVVTTA